MRGLAESLGVHRAVVYRLLRTLADHRLVVPERDRFRLGPGVTELAGSVEPHLQAVALPELRRLASAVGATAYLTVARGGEAVVLLVAEPPRSRVHMTYRAGLHHPLDVGASGLAILAGRPPLPGERPEVGEARERGWATSRGEIQPGAVGVAAPVVVGERAADASVGVVALGGLDAARVAEEVVAAARAVGDGLR